MSSPASASSPNIVVAPRPIPSRSAAVALYWTVAVLVLGPLAYWYATGQVWEDFLITFRASHNLATGHGLTYVPGTRVHCFTSPLNVLLPALFDWLTHTDGYAVPLALYNVLAVAAFAAAGGVIVKLARDTDGDVGPAMMLWPVMLICCHRVTAFVVNGQEAGFWTLFLALAFAAVVRGHDRCWLSAGFSWAALMWTRPDSPVYIVVFGVVALLFSQANGGRKAELIGLLRAAAVCTAGYLPWFAFAWWYYGSPVPHSLQAKIGAYIGAGLPWAPIPDLVRVRDVFGGFVSPIYGLRDADWGAGWLWAAAVLGAIAAAAWMFPRVSRLTRCASASFVGSLLYIAVIWSRGTAFPWYFVPASLFGSLVLVRLPFELLPFRRGQWLGVVVPVALAIQFMVPAVRSSAAEQQLIENDLRKPLGLWLRAQVRPGEHVFLEPIGYIGYYSGAALYDYPGLTSPEVVRARQQGAGFYDLIDRLRPTWLVLRSVELDGLGARKDILAQYRMAAVINQRPAIESRPRMRGGDFWGDSVFYVLVRADRPGSGK